jgi:xanthine dehydrogenase accessory factor
MLIIEDGTCVGTIGGGYAEAVIIEDGRKMFSEEPRPRILEVNLHADLAEDEGMICGGELEVFMEPLY